MNNSRSPQYKMTTLSQMTKKQTFLTLLWITICQVMKHTIQIWPRECIIKVELDICHVVVENLS